MNYLCAHRTVRRCVHLLCLNLCLSFATGANLYARTYYLDSEGGDDNNPGTSPQTAWASLQKASSLKYKPGDELLLQRGDRFRGKLELLQRVGAPDKPIVIGAFGSGELPIIDAAGYRAGVQLANCSHIELRDLEITADGGAPVDDSDATERYGVTASTWGRGSSKNLTLRNLYIHTIYPPQASENEGANPTTYMGKAIRISGSKENPYKDIRIEDCRIENTGHAVLHAMRTENLQILNNQMKDIGGPAMVPNRCDDLVVRGNIIDHSGAYTDKRMHGRGSGIWPIHCNRVLIEKNRFMHARGRYDSCGAHIDIGNRDVVIQYNMSIDNEGGFVEILGENENCAYRYNISINDGARRKNKQRKSGDGHVILFSGHNGQPERAGPKNCYVYNNTIYVKRDQPCSFSIEDTTKGVLVANNIFYVEGPAMDGTPAWYAKYPPGIEKTVYWKNNLYQKRGIFPSDWRFREYKATIKNPKLANPGGFKPEDYIPAAGSIVEDRGIEITKIRGDKQGLAIGLAVEQDFFGNPIVGRPDLGAIEISRPSTRLAKESTSPERDSSTNTLGQKNDFYQITNDQGRSIEARILHADARHVYVRLKNKRAFAIPRGKLSISTDDFITAWEKKHAGGLTAQQQAYLESLRSDAS